MTRRDFGWRVVGAALLVGGCVGGIAVQQAGDPSAIFPAFIVALAGIVLIAGGRRVVAAIRIELGRQRTLPAAVRARRAARHRNR